MVAAQDVEAIRHRMQVQHIDFAREHTPPFDAPGTAAGAYDPEENVARRNIQRKWQDLAREWTLLAKTSPCERVSMRLDCEIERRQRCKRDFRKGLGTWRSGDNIARFR